MMIHRPEQRQGLWTSGYPKKWWSLSGSNRRPEACKATALPAELRPPLGRPQAPAKASAFLASRATRRGGRSAFARRTTVSEATDKMVGLGRLERPTSPLSGVRSNHLSYRPQSKPKLRPMYPELRREAKTAASRIARPDWPLLFQEIRYERQPVRDEQMPPVRDRP